MEKLKEMLDVTRLANLAEETLEKEFAYIAERLCNDYCIRKGNVLYEFLEVEFYLYSDLHPDIATYPRDVNVGDWFFHQSGVDLCFNTSHQKDIYGGILLRSLKKKEQGKEDVYITGPLNCCYNLFDQFSAIEPDMAQYPCIQRRESSQAVAIHSYKRWLNFANPQSKYESLLSLSKNPKVMFSDFERMMDKYYRFCINLQHEVLDVATRRYFTYHQLL